jgi:hypothetical protein
MPTNETLREKCSRRTDDRHRLGTDAKGRTHYADAVLGAIWVTTNDEIAHIEQTDAIAQWVAYTREHVGWQNCQYSTQPTGEWLVDTLAEAI